MLKQDFGAPHRTKRQHQGAERQQRLGAIGIERQGLLVSGDRGLGVAVTPKTFGQSQRHPHPRMATARAMQSF